MSNKDLSWLDKVDVEADTKAIPKEEQLSTLARLATELRSLEDEIEETEERLQILKEDLSLISEVTIPDLMKDIGVEKITLSNGLRLSYKFFANGKVLDEKAYDWFENEGYSELVKSELTIKTRRIEKQDLAPVKALLREHNLEFSEKDHIHYQTMGAFLREKITEGHPLPPADLVEIHRGFKATVK